MSKGRARRPARSPAPPVRYAVVGLGHIAQVAVLPAFRHARNAELTALVSGDRDKLRKLGRKYRVEHLFHYDEIDRLLERRLVDAVYVALPNDLHRDATVRFASAGLHVLCEKPLGLSEAECREMIDAARANDVHLMTAYRLHFDPATLAALETVRSGRLGDPRWFHSTFSMQVTDRANIRLSAARGGGPLFDLGVYCINAARMMFESEPIAVQAIDTTGDPERFAEVPGTQTVTLRFPGDRIAAFTCSFEAAETSAYRIIGTRGDLVVEPAYEYADGLKHHLTVGGRSTTKTFPKRDQFAPELVAFSDAIRHGGDGYPAGDEGLADVRVVAAALRSVERRGPVDLAPLTLRRRPEPDQAMAFPPVKKPAEIKARSPSRT